MRCAEFGRCPAGDDTARTLPGTRGPFPACRCQSSHSPPLRVARSSPSHSSVRSSGRSHRRSSDPPAAPSIRGIRTSRMRTDRTRSRWPTSIATARPMSPSPTTATSSRRRSPSCATRAMARSIAHVPTQRAARRWTWWPPTSMVMATSTSRSRRAARARRVRTSWSTSTMGRRPRSRDRRGDRPGWCRRHPRSPARGTVAAHARAALLRAPPGHHAPPRSGPARSR